MNVGVVGDGRNVNKLIKPCMELVIWCRTERAERDRVPEVTR